MTQYSIGDLVGLDPDLTSGGEKFRGVTFKVLKVNPKTLKLQPLNGGRIVNASKFLVIPTGLTHTPASTAQDVPIVEHLCCGTLVRLSGLRGGSRFLNDGDLGVVLVDKGERINVAPLGGFEDRYGRFPRRCLTVVKPADVLNEVLVTTVVCPVINEKPF